MHCAQCVVQHLVSIVSLLTISCVLRWKSTQPTRISYWPPHTYPSLNTARIAFVPKFGSPSSPSDYRPISVSPVLLRAFHKVLQSWWPSLFPVGGVQFAFLKQDGAFKATALLRTLLRLSHTSFRSSSFASPDISKAFDSVSHDTILRAACTFGTSHSLLTTSALHILRLLASFRTAPC